MKRSPKQELEVIGAIMFEIVKLDIEDWPRVLHYVNSYAEDERKRRIGDLERNETTPKR